METPSENPGYAPGEEAIVDDVDLGGDCRRGMCPLLHEA